MADSFANNSFVNRNVVGKPFLTGHIVGQKGEDTRFSQSLTKLGCNLN